MGAVQHVYAMSVYMAAQVQLHCGHDGQSVSDQLLAFPCEAPKGAY